MKQTHPLMGAHFFAKEHSTTEFVSTKLQKKSQICKKEVKIYAKKEEKSEKINEKMCTSTKNDPQE